MHRLKALLSRNLGSAGLALVITSSLLLLMQHLIRSEESAVEEVAKSSTLNILPELEDEDVKTKVQPPKKVDPPVVPPETTIEQVVEGSTGQWIEIPTATLTTFGPRLGVGIPDGDILPIAKVSPVYPERARSRGVEGYVIVQFTVDELGRVLDVRVIESLPHNIFDRAAVEAVQRFKYKPRVVNGEATAVTGVQHRVTFELS